MLTPEILHLDNHVIVLDKPAGMLTQPNESEEKSLEEWAKHYLKIHFNKPGAVFLHALHRLDKPVGGIVLFARTSKALSRLNAAMRAKRMSKLYLAEVEGEVLLSEGVLEHYLLHGDHCALLANAETAQAKLARLSYRVCRGGENSRLEISLETGRYHQIRVQLAAIGHPVRGDRRYGSKQGWKAPGIALQHYQFQFPHPISNETITITANHPLP